MKKIRIGNDIVIKWRVTINGEEVNLEGLDLSLYISTTYQPRRAIAFTVAGNEITATYKGAEQKVTGVYRLTLYRNEGENAQSILDACDAFELVSCSCLTVDAAFGGAEVELPVADLGVGIPGLSAYEIACIEGFKGTQAEWIASLSAASEAAAAECREVIAEFSHAEDSRVAAEAQRVVNENDRIAGEGSRVEAENNRVAAEQLRAATESQRATAETARQEAEQGRVTTEQQRVDAEAARVEAEVARAEEFAGFTATLAAKEDVANKVTSINADADDVHYPSAKAVWSEIGVVATEVNNNRVLFDVSARFPTGGTDGTDNYTIETAIAAVPSNLRFNVKYLTFKTSDNERELWQFNSISTESITYFKDVKKWYKMRPSMYHDLEYNTNINSIRNSVPVSERVSGLIIHYTTPEGEDKYEMYVGENNALHEKFWENFVPIYVASNIDSQIKKSVTPIYVESRNGKFHNAIKELYLEKYEEGKQYIITQFSYNENYTNGSIWVSYEGAPNLYSTVSNNSVGGINGGIVTLESTDKSFKAHLIVDWNKIGYIYNDTSINLYLTEACKNIENSPTIYAKLSMAQIDYKASVGAGLESRLYNDSETIVFEDAAEQAGDVNYGYINIGLIHKAAKQEKFNAVYAQLWKSPTDEITTGSLVVKRGFDVSASGGTIIKEIDNFSNVSLPQSGLYEIKLGQDVTLEANEYLWVYYTGRSTMRTWTANNEEGTRVGIYFQGGINTYRYSSAIVLKQLKGDIISINERLSEVEETLGIGGDDTKLNSPLITLPEDLYVITGREQTFYFNEFIYGIESNVDNTLLNYNIGARVSPSGLGNKCVATKEGFTIYTKTSGEYTITVSIYDQYNNLLTQRICTLHSVDAPVVSEKSILMLGDSWTDINSGNKGYTPYVNAALKEMGITAKFIGTRDAGTSGLKHEGIGGYAWTTFASAPKTVRFIFFVDSMPSISSDDIYSNNGSTYKLYEKGSNYLTLSRQSGSTEPSGNALTRTSGTGDETITFTSWTVGGSNPLWNTMTNELDFTHYRRDLCGLSTPLDICNIQLGVNDSFGNIKITKAEWQDTITAASQIIDAILADSPNCKIIVNLAGMDCPSPTGWSSLSGLVDSKRGYQLNCYSLRTYINDLIKAREDYNTNVFIGQSVLGINRWYGYGYVDNRYRYFKVDADSMSSEDFEKLKNFDFQQRSVWVYTDVEHKEFQAHYYDARGYLVCKEQQGFASWDKHEQEFVNAQSVPQNTVPEAGNLTKGGGSSSVDFPVVPYTACYVENNNSKEHWFMNATHPYDLGYKQMAYCVAHQIASLLEE